MRTCAPRRPKRKCVRWTAGLCHWIPARVRTLPEALSGRPVGRPRSCCLRLTDTAYPAAWYVSGMIQSTKDLMMNFADGMRQRTARKIVGYRDEGRQQ